MLAFPFGIDTGQAYTARTMSFFTHVHQVPHELREALLRSQNQHVVFIKSERRDDSSSLQTDNDLHVASARRNCLWPPARNSVMYSHPLHGVVQ